MDRSSALQASIWTRFAVVLIAGAALYVLAGFLLAPNLIKSAIATAISNRTGHSVAIERVAVNPLNLTVELSNLFIDGPASTPIFSIARAEARVHIATLFGAGWVIRKLILDAPHLSIPVSADAQDSFVQLLASLAPAVRADESVPALHITQLWIRRGEMRLTARGTGVEIPLLPFEFAAIDLALNNLGTRTGTRADFTLAATVNESASLHAVGTFTPYPRVLDATVDLTGLDVAAIGSAIKPGTDLEFESALLAGQMKLHSEAGQTTVRGDIALHQIAMVARSTRARVFTAAELLATGMVIQTSPFRAAVDNLRLDTPHLWLARGPYGTLQGLDWLSPLIRGPANLDLPAQRIEIADGRLDFTDFSLWPPLQVEADRIHGRLGQGDAGAETTAILSLQGRILGAATGELTASWSTVDPSLSGSVDLSVAHLPAVLLSPYLAALAGRGIAAGELDLILEYRANDRQFVVADEFSVTDFQLAEHRDSTDGTDWPLDLAVALLTDGNDRIRVTVPVPPGPAEKNFRLLAAFRDAFREFVYAVAEMPFTVLGQVVGWSGPELGRFTFEAGSVALTASASAQLAALANALEQRPGLGLVVNGRYDPLADREALARQQMRLHVALAASAGPPGQAAMTPLVYTDPKVISILDEFATTRLRPDKLAAIRARFPEQGEAFYDAVFEALVANEAVSAKALKTLARYRAQSVVNQLVAAGIGADRLRVGTGIETSQLRGDTSLVELEVILQKGIDTRQD
jgi:hypothetical protein